MSLSILSDDDDLPVRLVEQHSLGLKLQSDTRLLIGRNGTESLYLIANNTRAH